MGHDKDQAALRARRSCAAELKWEPPMKRSATVFLQIVIVLLGIGTLALLLWEPHLEGRNKHATLFEVYFTDSFLVYVYLGSIPFFVALYQAFTVLGYAGQNKIF